MKNIIRLNNGVEMPMIGFGTYQMPPSITERCVSDALTVGYRHIDTAQCYGNEREVGLAVKKSGIKREDIFVTTKLWGCREFKDTLSSIDTSLVKLDLGYIDLLLIHEPTGDYREIYRAMERTYQEGKLRAIGVANFLEEHFHRLLQSTKIVPAVDQIETHVFRQQGAMGKILKSCGTVHESWSPLAAGRENIFRHPTLSHIAGAHGKTAAQIALRFLYQKGIPVIPKSTHIERMKENLDFLDFELSSDEMETIKSMDKGKSLFAWW